MDQTPLPFVLDDGTTYDAKGSKEICFTSGQSGLDKRQCTVQLTIFGDGIPTSKTDTDFPRSRETDKTWRKEKLGQKSQGLFPAESLVWRIDYEAMGVRWMGKRIHKSSFYWIQWENFSGWRAYGTTNRRSKTSSREQKTVLVNMPPGCTSRVQPLNVSVNKPFKNRVREQFENILMKT